MKKIDYQKIYLIDYYNPPSEAIYLGSKFTKRKCKHYFAVWHKETMKKGDTPILVATENFDVEGDLIKTFYVRKHFPKTNKLEKEYLMKLGEKYWG